jgi:putative ABC transport system permease protein
MIGHWLRGLILGRPWRVLGTGAGIAVTVALTVLIGAFITTSAAQMTRRALEGLPVDWQILLVPGTDEQAIAAVARKAAEIAQLETVGYADVAGFEAKTGETVQTTGAGKLIGIGSDYAAYLPNQMRLMLGKASGVLLAQQTAANLHASVGDTFTVERIGLPPAVLEVAGVVDLPNADVMFQGIGLPKGAEPQAPPDNVALIPMKEWHQLFDNQAWARPDTVRLQLHALLDRQQLPKSPDAAYASALAKGHNLEAHVAGQALLANNLAARLDAVRGDALYTKVLFLFLGAPGIGIAILLTVAVTAAGREQRRRDRALLRVRGATLERILALEAGEAIVSAAIGSVVGALLARVASAALFGVKRSFEVPLLWFIAGLVSAWVLTTLALLWPAWRDARSRTVIAERRSIDRSWKPLWVRAQLDIVCLVLAAASFWLTASNSYQLVLAPEGVPTSTVDYQAFLAPLFLWLGVGLASFRLVASGLRRGGSAVVFCLRPFAGRLAPIVSASLSRQQARLAAGIALAALTFAFATSTAVFNETYSAQAKVDAELTNGADVSISAQPFTDAARQVEAIRALPGVVAAEPMQHRFAYVGTDLQDLYGIDAEKLGQATRLSDAYFANGDAAAALKLVATTLNGVLVSEETVSDFQLSPGDTLNLRLQRAADHQYHTVPFTFIGVVREFPTAPHDSFLVANATYVAKESGSSAAETLLVKTSAKPVRVAAEIRRLPGMAPSLKVTDVGEASRIIGTSLTAIDVSGLTRLELAFSFLAIVGATGLVLALGLADRRRSFAILALLGAKREQLGAFIWSEAWLMLLAGAGIGILAGFGIAAMLVAMLAGVFDPPPDRLHIPIIYLCGLVAAALAATIFATVFGLRAGHDQALQDIRTTG